MCSDEFQPVGARDRDIRPSSACRMASNNGPRWRTRTMTSPGVAHAVRASRGPRSTSPPSIQDFTAFAIRWASLTMGLASLRASSGASQQERLPRPRFGLFRLPDLDEGRGRGSNCFDERSSSSPLERPRNASWFRTPHRPLQARRGADRKESNSFSGRKSEPVAFDAIRRRPRHFVELLRLGALKTEDRLLLVADHENRSFAVFAGSAPAKKSSVSFSITLHCSGLVSCASSISTWSMPPSSL